MAKKNGPSFARCNQCRLVFKDSNDCGMHAVLTGHKHKPSYYCTVCSMAFNKRKSRKKHSTSAGHVQKVPTTYAQVPAHPLAPSSTRTSAAPRIVLRTQPQPVASTSRAPQPTLFEESNSDTSDDEVSNPVLPPRYPTARRCMACKAQIKDGAAALADHRKVCHPFKIRDQVRDMPTPSASTSSPKLAEKPRCVTCNLTFPSEEALQTHYTKSYGHAICLGCGLGFDSPASLTKHKEQCSARKPAPIARPGQANTNGHATDGPSSVPASTATPSSTSVRGNDGPQAASTPPEIENTRCTKCDTAFSSAEALQAHYDESPLHPTCRTCGLGFPAIGPWAAHKARCPPPGSTTATYSAMGDRVSDASSWKGKEVARDLVPTSENVDVNSDASIESTSHIGQVEDAAAAGDMSSTTLTADLSDVSSVTLPTPTRPDIMNSQHMLTSPTPSVTASTATAVPYAHPSSQTISPRSLLEDKTDIAYHVTLGPGERAKPETPPQRAHELSAQPHGRSFIQGEAATGSSRSVVDSRSTRGLPTAYQTPLSGYTPRSGTPNDRRWDHAATQAALTLRPNTNRNPDVTAVSFHCRSCLRDPCVEPVATICGHLFCHRCIIQELSTKMCCPVCENIFFVRLHVEVA